MHYFIRSRGDFGYRFERALRCRRTGRLLAVFSYESEARDSIDGVKLDDGISSAWYAGPGLTFMWGENFSTTFNAVNHAARNRKRI